MGTPAAILRQPPTLRFSPTKLRRHLQADHSVLRAERLIAQELQRLHWEEPGLKEHPKSPPLKLAMAGRLRPETALTTRQIARRLHLGSWRGLNHKLYLRNKTAAKEPGK
jgi:hypothetical protein